MNKKTAYENPEFDIIKILSADVITTSYGGGTNNGIGEDNGENDGEWM